MTHDEIYKGRVARDERNYSSNTSNYRKTPNPIVSHDELLAEIDSYAYNYKPKSALRAVVELHKPVTEKQGLVLCSANCEDEYPCTTIQAIMGELK